MLHRSSSSRRRRASRSAASSPQTRPPRSAGTSPGRRASIAVSPVDSDSGRGFIPHNTNNSPRPSKVPNISLDASEPVIGLPCKSPRHSLVPDSALSPRNSLVPESVLSPRNSLLPDSALSPRNSLVPESALSPRNSLVPDSALSPRNSIANEQLLSRSPRHSLVPGEPYNRSPRGSLVPDACLSARNSLVPDSYSRNYRYSLVPESNCRSSRNSLVPDTNGCTGSRLNLSGESNRCSKLNLSIDPNSRVSRTSLVTPSETSTWHQKLNANNDEGSNKSPNRSPRGSIGPETCPPSRNSPRGSFTGEYGERSPRGSLGGEEITNFNRSPRGSIARGNLFHHGVDASKTPRRSLTLTFQDPAPSDRRASADNNSCGSKSGGRSSPYRAGSRTTINQGYSSTTALSESGSRRASSSTGLLQISDENRRLCGSSDSQHKHSGGEEQGLGLSIPLATYGSVAYQLKDANIEATGTCDFVCKALTIVNRTVIVTVVLVCLSTLPLLMLIMGVQFLRDCPREPHIPVYMVVGGSVGCVKMAWLLWNQLRNRRIEVNTMDASVVGAKVASVCLTLFLLAWFGLGNYWILRIKWPDFAPTLFEPNKWCHRTLYVFSLVHLFIVYSVGVVFVVLIIVLACLQLLGCSALGPSRYK